MRPANIDLQSTIMLAWVAICIFPPMKLTLEIATLIVKIKDFGILNEDREGARHESGI